MTKLKITILAVIIFLGIGIFSLQHNTEGTASIKEIRDGKLVIQKGTDTMILSPDMYASVIRSEAKSKDRNDYPAEEDVDGRIFLDAQISSQADTLIIVIGEGWLSGSGGSGGVVLMAKSDGSNAHVTGWVSSYLDKSLRISPKNDYAVYTEASLSGLCVSREYGLIDLRARTMGDISVPNDTINLNKKIKLGDEKLNPAVWSDDDTLQLDVPLRYCAKTLDDDISVGTVRHAIMR